MKILIVGAGMAGLSLAAHLQKSSHKVRIIEKASEFKNIGYVIGVWHAGLATLEEFLVMDRIEKVGHFPSRFDLRAKNGDLLKHLNFEDMHRFGKVVLIRRSDLQHILIDICRTIPIEFNLSPIEIKQEGQKAAVSLSDGTSDTYDLVVGADGIHSEVRRLVFGNHFFQYSGITSWLYLLPQGEHARLNPTSMWSDGKFVGFYPYHHDNSVHIIFAKSSRHPHKYTKDNIIHHLTKDFGDFGWIVPEVLRTMEDPNAIMQTNWNEVTMNQWHKGRVILIGDAAHAMLPLSGSGTTLALQDAYVLAQSLDRPDLEGALDAFCRERSQVVEEVRAKSDFVAKLIKLRFPYSIIDELARRILPEPIIKDSLAHMMTVMAIVARKKYYKRSRES